MVGKEKLARKPQCHPSQLLLFPPLRAREHPLRSLSVCSPQRPGAAVLVLSRAAVKKKRRRANKSEQLKREKAKQNDSV